MRRNAGTTLIELLGAMALTAFVLWGAFDLFDQLDRLQAEQGKRLQATLRSEAALSQLRVDLQRLAETAPRLAPDAPGLTLGDGQFDLAGIGVRYEIAQGQLRRIADGRTRVLLDPAGSLRLLPWSGSGYSETTSASYTARTLPQRLKLYVGGHRLELDLR